MLIFRLTSNRVGDCIRIQGVEGSRIPVTGKASEFSPKERAALSIPYNIAERYWRKTLEPLNPRILDPFLPTNWEKSHIL